MAEDDLNRAVVNAAGELRLDQQLVQRISVTDSGPVITGALLEGLPGPCDPVREPDVVDPIDVNCSNSPSTRSFELYNNTTADYQSPDGSGRRYTVWSKTVRAVRNAPFRVFFDFNHPELNGAGVSIIQSGAEPFALRDDDIFGPPGGEEEAQVYGVDGIVHALTNTQDGKYVYAGGAFSRAGYVEASRIVRWNTLKSTWESVGGNLPDTVRSLVAIEDNSNWKVYAGGSFGVRVYTESTGTWESLITLDSGSVLTMDHSDDGTKLFFGGDFVRGTSTGIAQYNLDTGTVINIGSVSGGAALVNDIAVYLNNIMVVGSFTSIGGVSTSEGVATSALSSISWTDRSGIPGFSTGWEATCVTWDNAFVVGGISKETSEQNSKYSVGGTGSFGKSVAVGDNRIVVGDEADADVAGNAGAAYIYELDGTQLAKITASDGAAGDQFGSSVAVGSGRIVIGARSDDDKARQAGSAYIYDLNGNLVKKIIADDGDTREFFGWSVAVGDNRIAIGAYHDGDKGFRSGSAYIYDLNGNLVKKIIPDDGTALDSFGGSVAVGSGRIVVGSIGDDDKGRSSGSAYIYDLNGNLVKKITASDGAALDYFGNSVAIGDGRIVVGAPLDNDDGSASGSAYIFDLAGNELAKITASDAAANDTFGTSIAVENDRIVVGAPATFSNSVSGSAYIFDLSGNQLAKITANDGADGDRFGISVAVDDNKVVVGAPVSAAYIFDTNGNQLDKITGDPDITDAETGFLATFSTSAETWSTPGNGPGGDAYTEAAIANARINALVPTNRGVWIGGDFSQLGIVTNNQNNLVALFDTSENRIEASITAGLAGPSVKALTYIENTNSDIPLVFGGEINSVGVPPKPAKNIVYRKSTVKGSSIINRFESAPPELPPADQEELAQVFAGWFEDPATRRLRDTRSDGITLTTSGGQIGRFGVDPISADLGTLSRPVLQLFDIDEQTLLETDFFVGLDDPAQLSGQNLIPVYSNQDELRTRGYGYIQTTVNCAQGEYVTVFVVADTAVQKPEASDAAKIWQIVLDYEKAAQGAGSNVTPCDPENENAPSRAYQQGAVVNEWVGGSQYGYFGQTQRSGETVGAVGSGLELTAAQPNERFVDNIYYPYEAPPVNYIEGIIRGLNSSFGSSLAQGYFREGSRWAGATGVIANVKQAPRYIRALDGVFSMPSGSRTVEIKGYFRAPTTGNYEFFGSASDGMWMWISSDGVGNKQRAGVDDLGNRWNGTTEQPMEGGEFFVQDGFSTGEGRNYGRNNYILRVGPRTANISGLQSNGIRVYLKEGSYYFVRILSGIAFQQGFFQIEYQIGSGGGNVIRNNLVFSGRTCATDSPSTYQDPVGSGVGGDGGGSVITGPGPGGGFGGGGGGPVIDLFGPGTPLPWWWGTTPTDPRSGPDRFTNN